MNEIKNSYLATSLIKRAQVLNEQTPSLEAGEVLQLTMSLGDRVTLVLQDSVKKGKCCKFDGAVTGYGQVYAKPGGGLPINSVRPVASFLAQPG